VHELPREHKVGQLQRVCEGATLFLPRNELQRVPNALFSEQSFGFL
jgi:hypothetical protein